jgi:hypothetical protein
MTQKLEPVIEDTPLSSCGMDPQKIHILYNKQNELCTEYVFSQELDKMQSIMKAKQELNTREDVVFYINSDDLIKVQNSKSPVYIRLRPEQPSSKITESMKIKTEPPKTSRSDKQSSSPSMPNITVNIEKPEKMALTPPIENRKTGSITKRHSSPRTKVTLEHKRVMMNHSIWNIAYKNSEKNYSIFEIDQKGVDLICKGMEDAEVDSLQVTNLKGIPVHYVFGNQHIDAYVYTSDINNIKSPIYFLLTTVDYNCDVQTFVNMIEDLINLAKLKYNENR